MKKLFLLLIMVCLIGAGSCTTQPKLTFYKLGSDSTTRDKFTFKMPSPVIVITGQQNEKEIPSWKPVFTSTVTPRNTLYAIKSANAWYIDAKYTISYQQNSSMLKSFGVELIDNRAKYIQELGSVAAALIPFLIGAPPKVQDDILRKILPYNVNVNECFGTALDMKGDGNLVSCEMPLKDKDGKDTDWKVIVVTDRNDQSKTTSYESFFTKDGYVSTDFPVPDCKEGFVYLKYQNEIQYLSPITFTNPTRLTTVPIPAKGSVTYHPICSADTVYAPADVAKPLDLLKTTIDQVVAAKKAYEQAIKAK